MNTQALTLAVIALACATMRNGSTATFDAVVYTALFWVALLAACLILAF